MINEIRKNRQLWRYLKNHPALLEDLILNPEHYEKMMNHYQQDRNEHLITKLKNMSMLLRLMEMTSNE